MDIQVQVLPLDDVSECVPGSIVFFGKLRFQYLRYFYDKLCVRASAGISSSTSANSAVKPLVHVQEGSFWCGAYDIISTLSEPELRVMVEKQCDAADANSNILSDDKVGSEFFQNNMPGNPIAFACASARMGSSAAVFTGTSKPLPNSTAIVCKRDIWTDPLYNYAMQNGPSINLTLLIETSMPPYDCDMRCSDKVRCVIMCGESAQWSEFGYKFLWMVPKDGFTAVVNAAIDRCVKEKGALLVDYSRMYDTAKKITLYYVKI